MRHHRVLPALLLIAIAGCLSDSSSQPRRSLFARSEPGSIVVRNETDQPLLHFVITGGRSRRVGRLSSVPPGADQYVTRPADAPPLPDSFDVSWRDARSGVDHATRVSLTDVKSADHPTESTLLIRILGNGDVVAGVLGEAELGR